MNSQIVSIKQALRSRSVLILFSCLIPVSLLFKSGFISVAVIWFFVFSMYSFKRDSAAPPYYTLLCLLPVLIFLLNLLGILYSEDGVAGFNLALRKIHLAAIPIGFLLLDRRKFQSHVHGIILSTFVVACLLASLVCIGAAFIKIIDAGSLSFVAAGQRHWYLTSHSLSSPLNLSAVYLSMYYNFALLVILNGEMRINPTLKSVLATYFGVSIVLCASSAGIASMMLIFCLWMAQTGRKKLLLLALAFTLLAVFLMALINSERLRLAVSNSLRFTYQYEDGSFSDFTADRIKIWMAAKSAINENWIIGHGTADGQTALEQAYEAKNLTREFQDHLNPHNQFISTALDLGLLGLIPLIAMLAIPFAFAIRKNTFLPVGFLMLITVFFCAESVLLRQKGIVFFAFFYGLMLSLIVSQGYEKRETVSQDEY